MARNKLEAGFNEAARRQEQANAPLPVDTPEPADTRPPRTPGQQAQYEAEMKQGREMVMQAEAEQKRVREQAAERRAKDLAKGKISPDDLS